jgi:DNA-directed RNA polymerase specialized sigma24 family protein
VLCAKGDDAALATLFDVLHPLVGSLAVAHAPDREVTDVVLHAFTRIWQHAHAFQPDAENAVSWVLGELSSSIAEHAADTRPRPAPRVRRAKPSVPAGEFQAPV